jgi:hypothetical protein
VGRARRWRTCSRGSEVTRPSRSGRSGSRAERHYSSSVSATDAHGRLRASSSDPRTPARSPRAGATR